jgi:polar amino acid transport system substrate-binding protein
MRKFILVLLIALIQPSNGIHAQENTITAPVIIASHPDRPPLAYQENEQIVGLFPELAGIIFLKLEIDYQKRFVGPWKRVLALTRQGQVDLIAGVYHKREREVYLAYSTPIFEDPTSIFVNKENPLAISDQQDLIGLRGVTLFGDSFGDSLDRFIEDYLRMVRVYSLEEMFDLLLGEKVDYIIFGYYAGRVAASQMGLQDQIAVALNELAVTEVYFAFSKKSPHLDLLPDINRELSDLRDQGTIDELVEMYVERYLSTILPPDNVSP